MVKESEEERERDLETESQRVSKKSMRKKLDKVLKRYKYELINENKDTAQTQPKKFGCQIH